MNNSAEDLQTLVEHGDIVRIASIFNQKNRQNGVSISSSYVNQLISGARRVQKGKSKEAFKIAERYLREKDRCRERLITA